MHIFRGHMDIGDEVVFPIYRSVVQVKEPFGLAVPE